jgi:phosphomevalonate kinase
VISERAKRDVRALWKSWKELSVGPLLSEADSNGITSPQTNQIPGLSRFIL